MIGVMEDVGTPLEAPARSGIGRSPLSRYARWQLRDFVRQRAGIMLLVAGLMSYPLFLSTWDGRALRPLELQQIREGLIYFIAGAVVALGTMLSTAGIVSEDRAQGYHRFLFAKPANLVRFYAQSFGVQFAGVMGTLALVVALYAMFVAPVQVGAVMVSSAVLFTLYGGIAFLFSSFTRREWVWTLGSIAAAGITFIAVNEWKYTLLTPLGWVLPPVEAFARMVEEFAEGRVASALAAAVVPVLYGAGAFVAGLFVLRRRSLSS